MISNNQVQDSSYVAASVRRILSSTKLLPKFAKNTAYFLTNCMGKIIRCHSDIFGLIISRKNHRIREFRRVSKNGKIECDCPRCSKDKIDQRKRSMTADFLASQALHCDRRACNNNRRNDEKNPGDNNNSSSIITCEKSAGSNTNDVIKNEKVGQAWWASKLERSEGEKATDNNSVSRATIQSQNTNNISTNLRTRSDNCFDKSAMNEHEIPVFNNNSDLINEKELLHSSCFNVSKSEPRNLRYKLRRKNRGTIVNVVTRRRRFSKNLQQEDEKRRIKNEQIGSSNNEIDSHHFLV